MRFSRFLFRATRGKAFVQFEELKISQGDRLKNIYDYDGFVMLMIFSWLIVFIANAYFIFIDTNSLMCKHNNYNN